ncbi:MAG: hypothetical protein AAF646_00870 [Pseudomonadota bacterium]
MTRSVLSLVFSLLVVVTSVGAGFARGQGAPAGSLTICRGHSVVTIFVDAAGNEVALPVLCPDCVLKSSGPAPPGTASAQQRAARPADWAPTQVAVVASAVKLPAARGPPQAL